MPIRAVLFDYGGVLAEEGFREGLKAIARQNRVDPVALHRLAVEVIYESGYVTGRGSEAEFWDMMRRRSGIRGRDAELSREILERFVLRPKMIGVARALRRDNLVTGILSDQTNWLDILNERDHFFQEFDQVFNSYYLGKGKKDLTIFEDVIRALGVSPPEALFVDDHQGNIERASHRGLKTIFYQDYDLFLAELQQILGRRMMLDGNW
ncbi:MAG: HAD family phosphatase [Thermodesulfobacteriota bacterium]